MSAPDYGLRLEPLWTWTGERRELELAADKYLLVHKISSASDVSFTVTRTARPRYEIASFTATKGSAIVFEADESGSLLRSLHTASLVIEPNVTVVLKYPSGDGFSPKMTATDVFENTTNTFDFVFTGILSARFSVDLQDASSLDVQLTNQVSLQLACCLCRCCSQVSRILTTQAPGFEVISKRWSIDSLDEVVTLRLSIGIPSEYISPNGTNAPTPQPFIRYSCQRNCNGHGRCIADDVCMCAEPYAAHPNFGCASPDQFETKVSWFLLHVQCVVLSTTQLAA